MGAGIQYRRPALGRGVLFGHRLFDCNFKNIFDTYPQGILNIVHDVIVEDFSKLILENYPFELLEKLQTVALTLTGVRH